MRYWALTIAGLALAGASIVAVDWGVYHLARTGTCASGGAYVSARPCPPGTVGHILALVFGIFGALIGTVIYATRGSGGRRSRVNAGTVVWSLGFLTIAASVALAGFGPASTGEDGGKIAAVVIGVIFVPMALAPLLFGARGRKRAAFLAQGKRCPGEVVSVEDTNITANNNPMVRITVRAEPPGEPPFTVTKHTTVSRVAIPRAGDRCTVIYDPADRERKNALEFGQAVRPAPAQVVPAAAVAGDGDDPIDKIEGLGKLRDQGLITPAEFDAHKARLLELL
jgi:hypothetical protein